MNSTLIIYNTTRYTRDYKFGKDKNKKNIKIIVFSLSCTFFPPPRSLRAVVFYYYIGRDQVSLFLSPSCILYVTPETGTRAVAATVVYSKEGPYAHNTIRSYNNNNNNNTVDQWLVCTTYMIIYAHEFII
jgi:hypothetical protein